MRKEIVFFLRNTAIIAVTLLTETANCQYSTISVFLPSGNLVHYENLWNITVSVEPVKPLAFYFIEIEVQDNNGIALWRARTYTFRINVSPLVVNPFQLRNFEPIDVLFPDDEWHRRLTAGGGVFSPGLYRIVYKLIETVDGCNWAGQPVALAAYDKEISGLLPPQLLLPFNDDTVKTEILLFAWLPAFPDLPAALFNYTLRLTEMMAYQVPEQAMAVNPLFFEAHDLILPQHAYPPTERPLTHGSRYAWQITAHREKTLIGYSPVWSFVYERPTKKTLIPLNTPVFLDGCAGETNNAVYTIKGNFLFFKYCEKYKDMDLKLHYSISDEAALREILSGTALPLSVQQGYNTYSIDISPLDERIFLLIMENEKREKHSLKFIRMKSK